MVLGNHDYQGCIQAQLDYVYVSTRWRLPGRYYAVEKAIDATASALLVFLDTSPFLSSYQANGPEYIESLQDSNPEPQLNWLGPTLAASSDNPTVTYLPLVHAVVERSVVHGSYRH